MDVALDGERVVKLKPVFGYLHRNHEKIAEKASYLASMPYTDRLDYFCSLTNNWAYALAVEKLAGIEVPERAEYIRVITAELTRIQNHASAIGFLMQEMGASGTPLMYAFREREKILDLFEELTGSRMMCNYMRFGGCRVELPKGWLEKAAKVVADAQLANVLVGTRAEVVAARKAETERAEAALVLSQKTYDRAKTLTEQGNAPQARLDQTTDALHESERGLDQAKSAYEQAVNGYTKEERAIAKANVEKADADIQSVQSVIDQLVVYAPVASQVYQRNVEPGEYVSPGVPLVTLINLGDLWVHFDLREDLVKGLKVGDKFDVRIPALDDRRITVEVKLIATKGEYASWRATRATGDFDLRTFSIRAYPVQPVPELRPGMSAYLDWQSR